MKIKESAVTNQNGKIVKSTTVYNLGSDFAMNGKVLLVDVDS